MTHTYDRRSTIIWYVTNWDCARARARVCHYDYHQRDTKYFIVLGGDFRHAHAHTHNLSWSHIRWWLISYHMYESWLSYVWVMSPIMCMSHVSYHVYESCLLSYVWVMSQLVTSDDGWFRPLLSSYIERDMTRERHDSHIESLMLPFVVFIDMTHMYDQRRDSYIW